MKMIQIVDVTHHILYTEYKAKIEFTSMINACVSHELRNPLNSIMAKNIEKEALYIELTKIVKSFGT
jgi:signal transduction histidine kinase